MKSLILRNCIALLVALLVGSTALEAARVADLFQAEVAAAGRDNAEREDALRRALSDVLLRITGGAQVLGHPAVQRLLKEPGRFVEQYRFNEAAADDGLRLWVQFDGVALSREVRAAGLPYWGSERPDVLLWLALDDRGNRGLVSAEGDSEAAAAVAAAAGRHGLPVTLPLMDLEDQRAVAFTDVWGGFLGGIEAASERYRPQVILVGKLERSDSGGWRGSWTLLAAGSRETWSGHADDLEGAVTRGVGGAAEWLGRQYAVAGSDASVRGLTVEGIDRVEEYARAYDYLASLTLVDEVRVVRVAEQEVQFDLTLSAPERSLLQVVKLGRTLEAVGDPTAWRFRLRH